MHCKPFRSIFAAAVLAALVLTTSLAAYAAAAPYVVKATIAKPVAGDNNLAISLKTASGAPVSGAKISASVAMTNMDMGTTTPPVKQIGPGKYASKVNFSMSGPWAITVHIKVGSGKPFTKVFDFNAN